MKIKATKVSELEYIDVEVTALATKISLGWHTKEQAVELRDMLLSVVDDLSGFIEERPFGYVKPEQILITANEAETLKELMEHAQTIPDLEAELREVLAGMGYDLVARSPFVEAEDYAAAIAEREPAVETPQDFSAVVAADGLDDWRNWREGDVIEVVGAVASYGRRFYPVGAIRTVVTDNDGDFGVGDTAGDVLTFGRLGHKKFKPECFRFHSRPAKGEK